MKKISNEIIESCKRLYQEEGLSCAEIARRTGIGEATIRRRLKALGVQIIQYRHAGKFEISDVINEYSNGISIKEIAKKYKSSEETISRVLKENGVEVFRNGVKPSFNSHIFDSIDTEEKAYWLGFIWADGCILNQRKEKHNYGFELGIAIKDIEHLKLFCNFISLDKSKIKIRLGKEIIFRDKTIKSGESCRIQISNEHFWKTLYNLGCVPDKTHHEIFPKESVFKSKELIHHFIRGFFDGDGWVYLNNRNYLNVGICGQQEFLETILKYIPEDIVKNINNLSNTEIIKVLRWGGTKAEVFLNYIYKNSTISLDRKFNISAPYIRKSMSKSGNIGKPPEMDNTEINSEIKESESSYSVEVETRI